MKLNLVSTLCLCSLLLIGCSGLLGKNKGTVGKTSEKTAKFAELINDLDAEKAVINDEKLTSIGAWSAGIDYSLQKETNQTPAVVIAHDLNARISVLANKPDFQELQEIYNIVDTLLTNKANGEKLLADKDKEILHLQKELKEVQEDRENIINKALKQSAANAAIADQYKATLNQMDSFFGGGAIWYGFKKLITKLAWFIGGGLLLYFVLRIAAAFNPIAATIFSVVNTLFSVVVKLIQSIAPKAVQVAGYIEQRVFDAYKGTLTHVVDAIQMCKEKEKAGVTIKIDDILAEASKSMDNEDKARIDQIKKDLNWK